MISSPEILFVHKSARKQSTVDSNRVVVVHVNICDFVCEIFICMQKCVKQLSYIGNNFVCKRTVGKSNVDKRYCRQLIYRQKELSLVYNLYLFISVHLFILLFFFKSK